MVTLDDFKFWQELTEVGIQPLVDDEDRDYVNQALSLMPAEPLDEQSWEKWTGEIKAVSLRKGKHLYLPLRKALTAKENGPDMSLLLPLLKKKPEKV